MNSIAGDFRYAFRTFRARPGLISVIVLTLAIGIGATTSIFSIVHTVILRPLPFREPERLVHIWEGSKGDHYQPSEDSSFIYARPGSFFDWRAQSKSFESTTAYAWRKMIATANDGAEILWAQEVADRFFEKLSASAVAGRTFEAADYLPNAPRLVLLSSRVWADRFGKDRRIVGRVLSLDREHYQVDGVMPAGFYLTRSDSPDLWITTSISLCAWLKVIPDLSRAKVAMAGIDADSLWRTRFSGLLIGFVAALSILLAVTGIYSVMSYSVSQRTKESGIRIALGADKARIPSLVMEETLRPALVGAALGCLTAFVAGRLAAAQLFQVGGNDLVTFLVTSISLIVVALAASYVPARRAVKVDPMVALQ